MRSRAGRAAVALAALALAAGGCSDLVSSLTPFGLGDRGPDQSQVVYTGSWAGSTSSGGAVDFVVAAGRVGPFGLEHMNGACSLTSVTDTTALIDDGRFTFDLEIVPQGRIEINGTFTTTETLSGSYTFNGLAATTGCPTSGGGSFTAAKTTQP